MNQSALLALRGLLKRREFTCTMQGKYVVLHSRSNALLFLILEECGFFQFHATNTRRLIVGLHQVVAFAHFGWKAYRNGFIARRGEVEVHHLDDDPTNNHPSNLVYVSPQENLLVAQAVRRFNSSRIITGQTIAFNRQGRLVKDPVAYFIRIVRLSIQRTLDICVENLRILLELPRDFGVARVQWCPRFSTRYHVLVA
jgi:HNH endonuclease